MFKNAIYATAAGILLVIAPRLVKHLFLELVDGLLTVLQPAHLSLGHGAILLLKVQQLAPQLGHTLHHKRNTT